jgi:hypothetical protein
MESEGSRAAALVRRSRHSFLVLAVGTANEHSGTLSATSFRPSTDGCRRSGSTTYSGSSDVAGAVNVPRI